ncbi:sulfate transporter CysZ [Halioglobus japonicus]|uniref:Sulfate transporter CysZ n=1 Tax=Halioglobus japonicus TaxID=930805 RepID=A0AAP8MBC7_9GAMM|nr:sulfate transporter CysZ [Halioglobus japonicus]AQA19926.1 sulfate transporter CysZ [Halioglobus japonicus]PLW84658.1 sulfate transporter CysZ [Halioglobus japonicus]GHD23147.1 sulfate transporter CysZ [Halioglobus japonicus]
MKGNVVNGVGYLFEGAKLLTHPSLRLFVLVPLAINIVIFGTLISIGMSYLIDWMDQALAWVPDWLSFIEWILWPLVGLTLSLMTGYMFTAVALIIASPFNGLLAEKAEELVTGKEVPALEGLGAALMMVPLGIVRELAKLMYYLPMAAFVLLITFIPVLNTVAPLLWFLLGAWMMSIQFVDYPMDNHQLSFGDVKEAVRSRRLSSMGFGGAVALCTGIPIVNFFVVPAAVVGATLLWCRELNR